MNNNNNNKYFIVDKQKKLLDFKKKFYNVYNSDFVENEIIFAELEFNKFGGRIVSIQKFNNLVFGHLSRKEIIYQFCIKRDLVNEQDFLISKKYLSVGDIIGIEGIVKFSNSKTLTLFVNKYIILSKFMLTLPDKKNFVSNNIREKRLLDIAFNIKNRQHFINKFLLLKYLRLFFFKNDFLEVTTPILSKLVGGADAKPFETFHNSLKLKLFLRIAPELYLKKMVSMGFHRVFEVAKCFRNEGISNRHNPEFTLVEFYIPFYNYIKMMDFIESLIKYLYFKLYKKKSILNFRGYKINLFSKWERITFVDFVSRKINKDLNISIKNNDMSMIDTLIDNYKIRDIVHEAEIKYKCKFTIFEKIFIIFEEVFSFEIIQPTFILNHPRKFSGLAKPLNGISAARSELYMGGIEISNLYSELNDPDKQLKFFNTQDEIHRDYNFINALKLGIPNTSGAGLGIDRIIMIFENISNIKDLILFVVNKKKF